tara:strand:- start:99 stop:1106 length:1008 start_codon:yes stop_codon:yes gene_type:complete
MKVLIYGRSIDNIMKFVYWGAVNSGSDHLNRMFEFNERQHVLYTNATYEFNKFIYPEPKTQELYHYYKPRNENKLVRVLYRTSRVKNPMKEQSYCYMEKYNFVDHRTTDYYKNKFITDSTVKRGLDKNTTNIDDYEPFLNHAPNTWEFALDDMLDGELLVRPHHLLGIVNYQRKYITTPKIISLLKNTTNIVPYKVDIIDSMVSKLNMFDPPKQSKIYTRQTGRPVVFKTIIDAYNRDKELVWCHLDEFTRQQRDIEQALQDYNIPYDYINLDEDDYSRFGCKIVLDSKYSHPNFDTNNPVVEHKRKMLEDMAREYVTVRGLTDTRLSNRIIDKI